MPSRNIMTMCAKQKRVSKAKTTKKDGVPAELLPAVSYVLEGGIDILNHIDAPKASITRLSKALSDEIGRQDVCPDEVVYKLDAGQVTDSPRDIGVLTVKKEDGSDVIPPQLIKRSHGKREAWASNKRREIGVLPKNIYGDKSVIVEDLIDRLVTIDEMNIGTSIRDRGPTLDGKEPEILGEELARALYNEYKGGILYSVGYIPGKVDTGRIPETHIKVTGKGYGLGVSFIDWHDAVNLDTMKEQGKFDEARNAIKEHIKMLTYIARSCLNDGQDARTWENFRRTLVHDLAETVGEGEYFHKIFMEVREECMKPATWAGDEQAADNYRRFFADVSKASQHLPVPEKPIETKTRLERALTRRQIKTTHATAIVDDLGKAIPDLELFEQLNFILKREPGSDVRKGYGILNVRGPEPEKELVGQYRIGIPESPEHAMMIHRASEAGICPKVLDRSSDGIVDRYIPESRFAIRGAEIPMSGNPDEVCMRIGQQTAVKFARMIGRNIMVDRDPDEYPEHTLIVGKGDDTDVLFTGWQNRVDLTKLSEAESDGLIKKHLRGIYKMFRSVPGYDVHAWGAFESTLPARARRADRKEMYEKLLDEFKTDMMEEDRSAEDFFIEASETAVKVPVHIPDEINDALLDAKFENPEWAWRCITHMADWGPEQEYAYGFTPEEVPVKRGERRESFIPTALKLVRLIKESGQDPDRTLRNLRRMGAIYDRCGARAYRNMASDMRSSVMFDKRDLYEQIETPAAVDALTYPMAIAVADNLAFRGAYLAKIAIESMACNPEFADKTIDLKPEPKDVSTLKDGVSERLKEVEETHAGEDIKSLTGHKVLALRRFAHLEFLRLGLMYTELMLGRPTQEQIEQINGEVSNMSNALLQAVYDTAKPLVDSELGTPTCGYAIVLGGANARGEFPTFDYDMIGIYEKKGKTSKGVPHKKYFNQLHRTIGTILFDIDHHPDHSISLMQHNTATIDEYMKTLTSQRHRWRAKAHIDLIHGAGDEKLSGGLIRKVKAYVNRTGNRRRILAQRYYDRTHRTLEEDYDPRNIKIRPGGLRDVLDVTWMHKLKNKLDENKVPRLLESIREDRLRGLKEGEYESESERMDGLLESYRFMMNVRIRMDILAGRNDKFLPEGRDLNLLARGLGYKTESKGRAEDKFMKDYEFHTGRIRSTTSDLILWMFKREELAEMEHLGGLADSNIARAVGFAADGSPITVEDLMIAKRLAVEMGELPEQDESGKTKFVDRDKVPENIRAALDHLRGSHFDPAKGKYVRLEDWEDALEKVQEKARRAGVRPPRHYKDADGKWVYGIPPPGYREGD